MKLTELCHVEKQSDRVVYKPKHNYTLSSPMSGIVETLTYWPEADEWNIRTTIHDVLISEEDVRLLMIHKIEYIDEGIELS